MPSLSRLGEGRCPLSLNSQYRYVSPALASHPLQHATEQSAATHSDDDSAGDQAFRCDLRHHGAVALPDIGVVERME